MSTGRVLSLCSLLAGAALLASALGRELALPRHGLALQQGPTCAITLRIDAGPTVEAAPGASVSIPFTAAVTLAQVAAASVSISIALPPGIDAGYAPASQTFSPPDPATLNTFTIPGAITATVPASATPGTAWIFASNSAALTCEFVDSGEPFFAASEAIGFSIVAVGQPPAPTATSAPEPTTTATATAPPTATNTATTTPTATEPPTPTATSTPAATQTPSPTLAPSATPSASPTVTASPTTTATTTPTASPTATGSPTTSPSAPARRTATRTPTAARNDATPTVTATMPDAPDPSPTQSEVPQPPTRTQAPPPDDAEQTLSLEYSGRREQVAETRAATSLVLRAGLGLLGAALLAGGLFSMWRGGSRS